MTRKEYNQCVKTWSDRLYGFALNNTKEVNDAKDIVQESFERLWIKHEEVQYPKAKSYLFSTAYHCIVDRHRKIKRMEVHELNRNSDYQEIEKNMDEKQWIQEGLSNMTEQEKSLILLRDYEGYSYDELSKLTNLSLSQVKVYLFRARKKFRSWLIEVNKINKVI